MRNELSTINNDNINDYIMIDANNFIKKTPFYIAIDNDFDTEFLEELLKKGADINIGQLRNNCYQNRPPLSNAIKKSRGVKMIRFLLENGADPNFLETSTWKTPLDYLYTNKSYSSLEKEIIKKMLLGKEAKTYIELSDWNKFTEVELN